MSINDIKDMPIQERMLLMEALWDSFVQNDTAVASPDWHGEILHTRAEIMKRENVKTYTIDELRQQR